MSSLNNEIFTRDSLITPPDGEPLELDYVKLHVKAISGAEDVLVAAWIAAARHYFEEQTGRQLITATWETWLDAFPRCNGKIELPHPPLQEVISVSYIDASGVLQSYSDGASPDLPFYTVKAPQGPYASRGWLEPISGNSWPTTRCESGAVRIRYRAGYGDSGDDVPELAKAALYFLVGHFEKFRSAVVEPLGNNPHEIPFGVEEIISGFKYSAYPTTLPRRLGSWVG